MLEPHNDVIVDHDSNQEHHYAAFQTSSKDPTVPKNFPGHDHVICENIVRSTSQIDM